MVVWNAPGLIGVNEPTLHFFGLDCRQRLGHERTTPAVWSCHAHYSQCVRKQLPFLCTEFARDG